MANFKSVIIDHLNLGVQNISTSTKFFEDALAPLGIRKFFDFPAEKTDSKTRIVGFGKENDRPIFWLIDGQTVGTRTHVAFQADSREVVDSFFEAALAAGAKDNGKPGLRFYHTNYYGAFVITPEGVNLEAVCHEPK